MSELRMDIPYLRSINSIVQKRAKLGQNKSMETALAM